MALDLKPGGPGFKSCSLPLDGFVFGGPEFNSSTLVNSQLVSLLPVIFALFVSIGPEKPH